MKKIFLFFIASILNLTAYSSFAQVKFGFKVGVSANRIGLNYENLDEEEALRDALKSKLGFTMGLAAEYSFMNSLSLQTGLQFTNKGVKTKQEEDEQFYRSTTSVNYLEIPVNLAYKLNKFQIHVGPYVGMGLFGKAKYEQNLFGETEKDEIKFKFKNKASQRDYADLDQNEDYVRLIDFGLNLGVGYRFGSTLLTVSYTKGLSPISPRSSDDNDKMTHKAVGIAATWFFQK